MISNEEIRAIANDQPITTNAQEFIFATMETAKEIAKAAYAKGLQDAADAVDPKLRAHVMSWDALQGANAALESIRALMEGDSDEL